jgi:hypothetical protein
MIIDILIDQGINKISKHKLANLTLIPHYTFSSTGMHRSINSTRFNGK